MTLPKKIDSIGLGRVFGKLAQKSKLQKSKLAQNFAYNFKKIFPTSGVSKTESNGKSLKKERYFMIDVIG